jgi:malate synthase
MQAAALKAADFFGNDDVLYLMEDAATGEIRLSILWEWVHKGARLTEHDSGTGAKKGDVFTVELFERLFAEEMAKLEKASNRDVHDDSKRTTLPIAGAIVEAYVKSPLKAPWYIDLLNLNIDNEDLSVAKERIAMYLAAFAKDGTRITRNLDFE